MKESIPLIQTNDSALVARGYNLGLKLVPNLLQVMTEEQLTFFESNLPALQDAAKRAVTLPTSLVVGIVESQIKVPNLRQTGPTLADWLTARETLHHFFTGETIVLRALFVFTEEELASTTLMPAFRPAGATNRMAVDWKKKMGVEVYEEDAHRGGVMMYKNSKGLKESELHLINRSVRPDEGTLGENAKSPDGLLLVPNTLWIGLYGWCDAGTLHFAITGEHLDHETLTLFPEDRLEDRLSGGHVSGGDWRGDRVWFDWSHRGDCYPCCGARSAKKVPLKT